MFDPLRPLYPVGLAGVHVATGWLLYHRIAAVLGGLFVLLGLLVAVAWVAGTVGSHLPAREGSA